MSQEEANKLTLSSLCLLPETEAFWALSFMSKYHLQTLLLRAVLRLSDIQRKVDQWKDADS